MTTIVSIPFTGPKVQYEQHDVKKLTSDIRKLAKTETVAAARVNALFPAVAEHVIAGGNVALLNNALDALKADRRRGVAIWAQAHVPHAFDSKSGKFGKKLRKPEPVVEAFGEFLMSGQTVLGWIGLNTKTEAKPTDYRVKLAKDAKKAIEDGVSAAEILYIIHDAIADAEDYAVA